MGSTTPRSTSCGPRWASFGGKASLNRDRNMTMNYDRHDYALALGLSTGKGTRRARAGGAVWPRTLASPTRYWHAPQCLGYPQEPQYAEAMENASGSWEPMPFRVLAFL